MIVVYILNVINFVLCLFYLEKFLHIFQCKDYKILRFLKYFSKKDAFFIVFYVFFLILQIIFDYFIFLICSQILLIFINSIYISTLITTNKTPLKFTGKVKRLYIISAVLLAPWCVFSFGTSAMMLLLFAMPALSNFINFYDKIKNKKYIKNASLKLANSNAVKIAITGSNGKTSVKNILYQILSSKYNTLKTPASFNTPLGISKFINENLTDNCEFIILEYGARHKNDIQNLCNIFGADYGIITTVAPQHLESFKSLQNVCIAKSKLSSYLDNNYCIYNIDNLCCKRMYNNKIGKKVSTSIHEKADVYASEINIENFKTYFKLHTNNKTYNVSTSLLGRHNISNILQATALALSFDVDIKEIIQTIKDLKPTSHRLEYIKSHINILDDSYNCSIISAKESLYVLQQTNYKKMVVTPGIIEGGKKEYELNFKLGKMCAFCDYVVIVGNHNKQAITEGLKSKNYDIKKICYSPTLEDAKKYFTLLSDNDTLLLLNDLPDDYK